MTTTCPALQSLIAAGYDVSAIVSNYAESQSRNLRALEVSSVAEQYDIPVLLPKRLLDIKPQLEVLHASVGILVAYGKIVPQEIIDIFPHGIINIHPSLLPLHRGPTPVESAILEGASETGVSLMRLVRAMDAGPIFAQTKITLSGKETKQILASRLLDAGKELLIRHLPAILSGDLDPKDQDDSAATYDKLIQKGDGLIDWLKPAEQLEHEVRAFTGWPQSRYVISCWLHSSWKRSDYHFGSCRHAYARQPEPR